MVLQMTACRLKELARHDSPRTLVPNFVPTVPEFVPQFEITACHSIKPGGVGKGVIAAGEGAADVVTLGLAEVLFTPLEAGTTNAKHSVTFCYDNDEKLLSFHDAPPE
jgi:hypothetical protein